MAPARRLARVVAHPWPNGFGPAPGACLPGKAERIGIESLLIQPENAVKSCSTMRIKRRMVGELGQNEPGANLACQAGSLRDAGVTGASPARAGGPQLQGVARACGPQGQPRPSSLGLAACSRSGLTSILGEAEFRIVAAARAGRGNHAFTLSQDQRLLLIVDAGDAFELRGWEKSERFKGDILAARDRLFSPTPMQIRNLADAVSRWCPCLLCKRGDG